MVFSLLHDCLLLYFYRWWRWWPWSTIVPGSNSYSNSCFPTSNWVSFSFSWKAIGCWIWLWGCWSVPLWNSLHHAGDFFCLTNLIFCQLCTQTKLLKHEFILYIIYVYRPFHIMICINIHMHACSSKMNIY